MKNVFVGRQPIYDRNLFIYGYELLSRSSHAHEVGVADGDQATSQVAINAFMEIGLDRIVGNCPAFINLTRRFVVETDGLPFPADRVVLEILEDVEPDAEVVQRLRDLKNQGYVIALDDFVYDPRRDPMLDAARIVKLDVQALTHEQLAEHVRKLRAWPIKLLAEKIETRAEFDHCWKLGFDYFQGYFLAEPNIVEGQQLPPNRLAILQLLVALQNPEADSGDIEKLVVQDVGLSYKILRYINSAFFALPRRIESLRQAVTFLGMQAIKTWATLLAMSGMSDKPPALVHAAMQRARVCELLAGAARRDHPEVYFTVGLFSLLEALMDAPLPAILDSLPFTEDVRQALLTHAGPCGEALRCVLAYEKGDWDNVRFDALDAGKITETWLEATAWADQAAGALSGAGESRKAAASA
jgi:EAL and modified HD-GYP domain-containing signal transduction protein